MRPRQTAHAPSGTNFQETERASIDAASDATGLSAAQFGELLERVSAHSRQVLDTLDVPFGVTVEQAAERLDVTAPTIRKRLKEGLLKGSRVASRPRSIRAAPSSSSGR